jgi:hypothetical protein
MSVKVSINDKPTNKIVSFQDICKEPGIYKQITTNSGSDISDSFGIFIFDGKYLYYTDNGYSRFLVVNDWLESVYKDLQFEKLNSKSITVTFEFD